MLIVNTVVFPFIHFSIYWRFQNEQTANILKTGRNTLDRYDQSVTVFLLIDASDP